MLIIRNEECAKATDQTGKNFKNLAICNKKEEEKSFYVHFSRMPGSAPVSAPGSTYFGLLAGLSIKNVLIRSTMCLHSLFHKSTSEISSALLAGLLAESWETFIPRVRSGRHSGFLNQEFAKSARLEHILRLPGSFKCTFWQIDSSEGLADRLRDSLYILPKGYVG